MSRLVVAVTVAGLAGCAGVRPTPNAVIDAEPSPVTVREPTTRVPVPFEKRACPLTTKSKSAPSCFKPLDASHPALLRAQRTTCRFATQAHFVGVRPALSVLINVIEGNVGFSIPFLYEGDGSTHPVPDELTSPVWSNDGMVGVGNDGKQRGFWKDGTCELPPEGHLDALAPLTDGRFVALWTMDDRTRVVLERSTDGAWSSLGPSLQMYAERLVAQEGRVALMFDSTTASAVQRDFGTEHPDLGRTLVLGRMTEQPKYTEFIPSGGWVPLPAAKDTTFSRAVAVSDGSLGGEPVLFVPRGDGSVRVPVPELVVDAKTGCPEPTEPDGKATTGRWLRASAAGATSWRPGILLARLESRGECSSRLVSAPPRNCPPGAPCAPPEGPRRHTTQTETELSLVLMNVGERSGPLLRLTLPPRDQQDVGRIAGVAVASTEREVFVSAEGFFFVFDKAELERRAR